jgi:chaperonin GroES
MEIRGGLNAGVCNRADGMQRAHSRETTLRKQQHNRMLTPLYERLIIKPIEPAAPEQSTGLQGPAAKNELPLAEVIAIGDGRLKQDGTTVPLKVKVGDLIRYDKRTRQGYKEYFIITENDIYGIEDGK